MTLRLWSWPMKCQRKLRGGPSPWPRAPGRGSRPPASARPRRATPRSSSGMYLTAASSSTSPGSRPALRAAAAISPARARARAAPSRPRRRGSGPPHDPRLPPGDAAVAAVGEEQAGPRTSCTARRRGPRSTPAACELRRARPSRGRGCARRRGRRSRSKRGVDLLADLVAAAARRRAERGARPRPSRAELAQRARRPRHDPRRQPAPAAVQRRHGAVGDEHHRQAVGDEHERRRVLERGRLAVLGRVRPLAGRAARWRGARSPRGPGGRRGSARAARRPPRPAARGSRRRSRRGRRSAGRG